MLAVIADDITGAAEVAGVGLRHGLQVALDTAITLAPTDVQLWVVALDTRSMQRDEAVKTITDTTQKLFELGVRQIFKKTDSVLRGHVVAELQAQQKVQGKSKILLCPANPAGGRKIINGTYLINDIPLAQTGFAHDPEFPATTSNVAELLQGNSAITVPNAASVEDLKTAASQVDDDTIPAGSAAFFDAWLDVELSKLSHSKIVAMLDSEDNCPVYCRRLIVCGSAFHASHERVEQARKSGTTVVYISPLWINTPQLTQNLQTCVNKAQQGLQQSGRAIVAVDLPTLEGKDAAVALRSAVSQVTIELLNIADIQEVIIEGGATAFAIVEQLGLTKFLPVNELMPGVVRMKVVERESLYLTIKPGSYDFPKEVEKLMNNY